MNKLIFSLFLNKDNHNFIRIVTYILISLLLSFCLNNSLFVLDSVYDNYNINSATIIISSVLLSITVIYFLVMILNKKNSIIKKSICDLPISRFNHIVAFYSIDLLYSLIGTSIGYSIFVFGYITFKIIFKATSSILVSNIFLFILPSIIPIIFSLIVSSLSYYNKTLIENRVFSLSFGTGIVVVDLFLFMFFKENIFVSILFLIILSIVVMYLVMYIFTVLKESIRSSRIKNRLSIMSHLISYKMIIFYVISIFFIVLSSINLDISIKDYSKRENFTKYQYLYDDTQKQNELEEYLISEGYQYIVADKITSGRLNGNNLYICDIDTNQISYFYDIQNLKEFNNENYIYLPLFYKTYHKYEIGDQIEITIEDEVHKFVIADFISDHMNYISFAHIENATTDDEVLLIKSLSDRIKNNVYNELNINLKEETIINKLYYLSSNFRLIANIIFYALMIISLIICYIIVRRDYYSSKTLEINNLYGAPFRHNEVKNILLLSNEIIYTISFILISTIIILAKLFYGTYLESSLNRSYYTLEYRVLVISLIAIFIFYNIIILIDNAIALKNKIKEDYYER